MYTLRYTGGFIWGELESGWVVNFGIDANPPTAITRACGIASGKRVDSGVCEGHGVGIGITFGGCGRTRSSKEGEHNVSEVSCRVCCRLGPPLPGGDGGKDAGRGETGRISRGEVSETKDSVSTV
jgi:hypothetical protein